MKRSLVLAFIFYISTALSTLASVPLDTLKNVNHYVFKDTAGENIQLKKFNGNFIFIDIWSMSCIPCLRQIPHLEKLKEIYQNQPIEFVSICVDNNLPLWKDFLQRKSMGGHQYITPIMSPFLRDNKFIAVPRFVLLDKKGNILWNRAKFPSDPDLEKDLDKLFLEAVSE